MIDTKELRLGNYIIENGNGIIKLTGTSFDNISESRIGGLDSMFVTPITLTKDILFKCGFTEDQNGLFNLSWTCGMDKTKTIQFELGEDYVCCTFWIGSGNDKMFLDCKYLHQLQNLYYALRHEELNVNL